MCEPSDNNSVIAVGPADPAPDGLVLVFSGGLVDVGDAFAQVEPGVGLVVHALDFEQRLVLVLVHFGSEGEEGGGMGYLRKPRNTDFTQRRTGAQVFFGVIFFVIKINNQLY
jgi:hypothetical protein